ncbi:WD40 repeat protein [Malassezia nana]|uniref:WD40 repeat protein n=1 Tax=Malassezia nana TaxID=180528 RepID=A0AAF0ELV7_9BASI|nr:WD40 repeat protein [Malassezia nana]
MYWPSGSARRLSAAPAGLPDVPHDAIHMARARNGTLWLLLTRTALLVWRTRPAELVAVVERTPHGLAQHGENVFAVWRHDAGAIALQTSRDALLFYDVVQPADASVYALARADAPELAPSVAARLATFQPEVGDAMHTPHGEPLGPRYALHVPLRHALHVDPGIASIAPLGTHVLVATRTPPAVQLLAWPGEKEAPTPPPVLLRDLPWLDDAPVVHAEHSYATDLSAWLTSDGCAYVVSLTDAWRGALAYTPKQGVTPVATAVNARFSMLALGLDDGRIALFEFQTSTQTPQQTHELVLPAALGSPGAVRALIWSPEGHALAVGYAHGWALWSALGRLVAHSFRDDWAVATRVFRDGFAFGVQSLFWGLGGTELFLLPVDPQDAWVHVLPLVQSTTALHMTPGEAGAALLLDNDNVYLYRSREQSEAGLLTPDSDAWRRVALPAEYAAAQWPMRYVTLSADGRFLAVAGRRGLAHYSTVSGRWKLYENAAQAQAFRVRGGLAWFEHVLIAACDCQGEIQVRLYSRDTPLDNAHLLDLCVVPAPVITLQLLGTSLLLYLADNTLVHYTVTATATQIRLQLCGSISFDGIIGEPARVRACSWRLPAVPQSLGAADDLSHASLIFLIDGMLVLLRPVRAHDTDELSYDLQVLHEYLETFWTVPAHGPCAHALWGWDGTHMLVWLDPSATPLRVALPDETYPLCVLLERGLVLSAKSVATVRRTLDTVSFRVRLHTTLYIDAVLRAVLTHQGIAPAVEAAASYVSLPYFAHALERLLHAVLEEEADARPPPAKGQRLVARIASFLDHYACSVAVVAGAARKTEASRWSYLFACVGAPRALLTHAVQAHDWDTTCALLLVVHTLDDEASSIASTGHALARMAQSQAWSSIREVISFLASMDEYARRVRACVAAAAHEAPHSVFEAWLEAASIARVEAVPPPSDAPLDSDGEPEPEPEPELEPEPEVSPSRPGLGAGPRRPSEAARREACSVTEPRASPAQVLHRAARHASLTLSPSLPRMQANGRVVVGPAGAAARAWEDRA